MKNTSPQWERIGQLPEDERQRTLRSFYEKVLDLPEADRDAPLREMIAAIYELPAPDLRAVTRSRLLAWTAMDPTQARDIAGAYDKAMESLPGSVAMRRVALVQSISSELDEEERQRLHSLLPHMFPLNVKNAQEPSQPEPWWVFWRRRLKGSLSG